MRSWILALLLVLSSLCAAVMHVTLARADESALVPYIYRIKSDNCAHAPLARRQSGFRVAGLAGIVTALHGVADCATVSAIGEDDAEFLTELVIIAVDIERDVALLSSPEVAKQPKQGLRPAELSTEILLTTPLRVVGYPLGLDTQTVEMVAPVHTMESLDDLIPDAQESVDFLKRNSPSIRVEVLTLQVQLHPGHAGSPVINEEGHLVAISDGGLRGATEARSWAMLWSDVELQMVDDHTQKALNTLAAREVSALALSSTYPTQLEEKTVSFTYQMRVVNAANVPIANAEVLLTHDGGYEVGFTDSEGFYRFQLSTAVDDTQRQIQIEAAGYERYSRSLQTPLRSVGVDMFRLTAIQPTATVTPTATPTVTPTATSTATPTVPPTNTSAVANQQICAFAFLVLDAQTEEPIKKATVLVILGVRQESGVTDSTGYYLANLPCDNVRAVDAHIRVFADGYSSYNRSINLIGQLTEILLSEQVTPTPTETRIPPTPTATPTTELTEFSVGDWVAAVASLRIREYPGIGTAVLETLPRNEVFRIADGPESADELTWWQLAEIDGTVRGWAAYIVDADGPSLQRISARSATLEPPRATAQPTAQPAAQPTVSAAMLEIVNPQWGESISGPYEIRWHYAGTLGPNQGFDLVLWYPKEPKRWGIVDAKELAQKLVNHGNGEYSVTLNVSSAPSVEHYCDASYLLYVTVIQVEPYARIGPESEMVDVRVRPISGVCG